MCPGRTHYFQRDTPDQNARQIDGAENIADAPVPLLGHPSEQEVRPAEIDFAANIVEADVV